MNEIQITKQIEVKSVNKLSEESFFAIKGELQDGRLTMSGTVFVNIVVVFNSFPKLATHLFSMLWIVRLPVYDKNGF